MLAQQIKKIFLIPLVMSLAISCAPSERAVRISKLQGIAMTGKVHYNELCSNCHGSDGRGGRGVNLIEHRDGHDEAELIDMILEGGNGMPSYQHLEDQLIADIISYIMNL